MTELPAIQARGPEDLDDSFIMTGRFFFVFVLSICIIGFYCQGGVSCRAVCVLGQGVQRFKRHALNRGGKIGNHHLLALGDAGLNIDIFIVFPGQGNLADIQGVAGIDPYGVVILESGPGQRHHIIKCPAGNFHMDIVIDH